MPATTDAKIADPSLAAAGKNRIVWAGEHMPVLRLVGDQFEKERPLQGKRLAACLHVTSETANLMLALKRGGAELRLCASNPLSTQDDVAASLVHDYGISVFASYGEESDSYYDNIHRAMEFSPHVAMDDGGDLSTYAHTDGTHTAGSIVGGTEETTTGVIRFRAMEREGVLKYPLIAVNDSRTKHLFDNRYGTGQSTIDGILRATNVLLSGSNFVIAGYGWCGRGVAMRAAGMGARVTVTEVDPVRALEAAMDGYQVMPMSEAVKVGDIFVTVTGDKHVISAEHIAGLKDGAIVSNSGHFDIEIDTQALDAAAMRVEPVRKDTERYVMKDGRKVYLLAQGRLVNLAAAEGHPPGVMDMSFANQALASRHLIEHGKDMERKVHTLPKEIDNRIASLKLGSMGIGFDTLTPEQVSYLSEWREGT